MHEPPNEHLRNAIAILQLESDWSTRTPFEAIDSRILRASHDAPWLCDDVGVRTARSLLHHAQSLREMHHATKAAIHRLLWAAIQQLEVWAVLGNPPRKKSLEDMTLSQLQLAALRAFPSSPRQLEIHAEINKRHARGEKTWLPPLRRTRRGRNINPPLVVLGNPPGRGRKLGNLTYVEYRHSTDGRKYHHDFKPAVRVMLKRDGTVSLEGNDERRLWKLFDVDAAGNRVR